MIFLTDFFDAASRRHNDVILLPAIRKVYGNDIVFQQDSAPASNISLAPAHRDAHVQQLNYCLFIEKKHVTNVRARIKHKKIKAI